MVAIMIALTCFAAAGFLIRIEWDDQQRARHAPRSRRARGLREFAQAMSGWIAKPAPAPDEALLVDEVDWPPSPVLPLEDDAAIRRTAEIGAWGSMWLAESHASDSPREATRVHRSND